MTVKFDDIVASTLALGGRAPHLAVDNKSRTLGVGFAKPIGHFFTFDTSRKGDGRAGHVSPRLEFRVIWLFLS